VSSAGFLPTVKDSRFALPWPARCLGNVGGLPHGKDTYSTALLLDLQSEQRTLTPFRVGIWHLGAHGSVVWGPWNICDEQCDGVYNYRSRNNIKITNGFTNRRILPNMLMASKVVGIVHFSHL